MPPTAAAFLPHPPLLVPELAGAAAPELERLRDACRLALEAVIAAAGTIILIGDGPVWGVPHPAAPGSFRPYGADREVVLPALVDLDLAGLPEPARLAGLPLSLAVAAYLLAGLDTPPDRLFAATVPASLGPGAAAGIGRHLAATPPASVGPGTTPASPGPGAAAGIGRHLATTAQGPGPRAGTLAGDGAAGLAGDGGVGLVAMGDLSACRTDRAPGGLRPEAAGFDASVAAAFRTGELDRLLDLDPNQAADLLAVGRVPLQVLAGALAGAPAVRGRVLYEDAPYGVGYLVACLTAS